MRSCWSGWVRSEERRDVLSKVLQLCWDWGMRKAFFHVVCWKPLAAPVAVLAMITASFAHEVKKGEPFKECAEALDAAGFEESGLEIVSMDKDRDLDFWAVDEGVPIVSHSKSSGRIVDVSFFLCDERPKGERKDFRFEVKSFNTTTKELVLKLN